MKYEHTHKVFMLAVNEMVTSPKSIQERVGDAYLCRLTYLKPEELPEKIRCKFINTAECLTSVTIKTLTTEEAIVIAQDIIYMWDILNITYRQDE